MVLSRSENILRKPMPAKAMTNKAAPPRAATVKSATLGAGGSTAAAPPGAASGAPGSPAASGKAGGEPPSANTAAATPEQAAAFIAELSRSLGELARAHRFAALAYLFELAALEAQRLGGAPSAAAPPREHRQAIS
jgi:hypothetical protein